MSDYLKEDRDYYFKLLNGYRAIVKDIRRQYRAYYNDRVPYFYLRGINPLREVLAELKKDIASYKEEKSIRLKNEYRPDYIVARG